MSKSLFAYCGHHKSGSTWIYQIIEAACRHGGRSMLHATGPHDFDGGDLAATWRRLGFDVLTLVNANYAYLADMPVRGIHVVRDPRDVVVSGYFSHLHSHPAEHWPALQHYREALATVDQDAGLMMEMEFSAGVMADMRSWPADPPGILTLRFEDMIGDQAPVAFHRIFDRLGFWEAGFDEPALLRILEQFSFRALSQGRDPGQVDVRHHYRKGVAGDWRNHFKPAHRWIFKRRYNDLLVRYGYESDAAWE